MDANIRKDIFVAVITSGSMQQKQNWKQTCEDAAKWVFSDDTLKPEDTVDILAKAGKPKGKAKKKKQTR